MNTENKHILVVEDSENILLLLEHMLDYEGWQVSSLSSLNDILDHVNEIKPDIILMDMLLSGANGCDACRSIKAKKELRNIPIVIMSAHPEAHIEAKVAGANHFVEKPFEMDSLLEALDNLLKSSKTAKN